MSGIKGNKYYALHKITNIFYLIIIIPFLIVGFVSAMSMYSTKMSGGLPNLFGYYVIAMPNDSWYWDASVNPSNPSNGQMTQKYGKYKKGNLFIFKTVNVDNLKTGDRVVYYSELEGEEIGGSYPSWTPLNIGNQPSLVGGESNKAQVLIGELSGKKATITDENDVEHVCYSYYASCIKFEATTSSLLLAENIIGVEVGQNQFLISLIMFVSSINGFLSLIIAPIICLILLKIISLVCYKKYLQTVDFTQKAQIFSTGQNVSYAKVVQGVRQAKAAATQRGAGAPMPPPPARNVGVQAPRTQTPSAKPPQNARTAAKPAAPTPQVQKPVATKTTTQSTRKTKKQAQQEPKIVSTRLANKNKK